MHTDLILSEIGLIGYFELELASTVIFTFVLNLLSQGYAPLLILRDSS